MNTKRIISCICACAMTVSVFAGIPIMSNAEDGNEGINREITIDAGAYGSLTVKNGDEVIESGALIPDGTVLTVTAAHMVGKSVTAKANDEEITDGTVTVTADTNITAEYADTDSREINLKTEADYNSTYAKVLSGEYKFGPGNNGTNATNAIVYFGQADLTGLDTINVRYKSDNLTYDFHLVPADADDGNSYSSELALTKEIAFVNDETYTEIKSGTFDEALDGVYGIYCHMYNPNGSKYNMRNIDKIWFTAGAAEPDRVVAIDAGAYGSLTVKNGDTVVESGMSVPNGTVLAVTAAHMVGKSVTVKANDEEITDGIVTITADTNITAEYADTDNREINLKTETDYNTTYAKVLSGKYGFGPGSNGTKATDALVYFGQADLTGLDSVNVRYKSDNLTYDFRLLPVADDNADRDSFNAESAIAAEIAFANDESYTAIKSVTFAQTLDGVYGIYCHMYNPNGNYEMRNIDKIWFTAGVAEPDRVVTIDAGTYGSLTVKNGDTVVESGASVPNGTVLTVTAAHMVGKSVTVKANGEEVTDGIVTVTGDTSITAEYADTENREINLKTETDYNSTYAKVLSGKYGFGPGSYGTNATNALVYFGQADLTGLDSVNVRYKSDNLTYDFRLVPIADDNADRDSFNAESAIAAEIAFANDESYTEIESVTFDQALNGVYGIYCHIYNPNGSSYNMRNIDRIWFTAGTDKPDPVGRVEAADFILNNNNASANITNSLDHDVTISLMVAVYAENNTLVSVKADTQTIAAGTTAALSAQNTDSGAVVKAFLWNMSDNYKPLKDAIIQ